MVLNYKHLNPKEKSLNLKNLNNNKFNLNQNMHINNILSDIDILKSILEYNSFSNSFELTTKEKQERKVEVQNKVKEINLKLNEYNNSLDSILRVTNKDFYFETFMENLKNKLTFDEINPRIKIEKELERLKASKDKLEKDLEESEEFKRIEFIKYINDSNRDFVKKMYYNGPEDIERLKFLIVRGFDVSDSFYPIIRLIERGRTIGFIKFLIQNGLKLNHNDIVALKENNFFDSQDFLEAVYDAKQIFNSVVNEILQNNG